MRRLDVRMVICIFLGHKYNAVLDNSVKRFREFRVLASGRFVKAISLFREIQQTVRLLNCKMGEETDEMDRKKMEVRARLEQQSQAKKKKGFMTPERKKKLRVKRESCNVLCSQVSMLWDFQAAGPSF